MHNLVMSDGNSENIVRSLSLSRVCFVLYISRYRKRIKSPHYLMCLYNEIKRKINVRIFFLSLVFENCFRREFLLHRMKRRRKTSEK